MPAHATSLAWIALLIGGFCELALVHFMRAAAGRILSWQFLTACAVGCLGCVFVTYAARFFPSATVYIMWVGIGGLLITITGMLAWNEPASAVGILGILLVLAGLIVLRITAQPAA